MIKELAAGLIGAAIPVGAVAAAEVVRARKKGEAPKIKSSDRGQELQRRYQAIVERARDSTVVDQAVMNSLVEQLAVFWGGDPEDIPPPTDLGQRLLIDAQLLRIEAYLDGAGV